MDKTNQALMAVSVLEDYLKDVPGEVFDSQKLSELIVHRSMRLQMGRTVGYLRANAAWDRPRLAAASGVSAETILSIERGKTVVEDCIYDKLLRPFGHSAAELYSQENCHVRNSFRSDP